MTRPDPELAVIVLAVGAPPELRTAVASLVQQSVPLEIVVVNSQGGDPHAVLADAPVDIKIISVSHLLWPGAARNLGIQSCRAPWIAFLAADLIAKEGWAANRLALHKQGRRSVASAVVNSHPRNLYAWASHLSVLVRRLPRVPRRKALRYGASYSRSLFEQYGQFREDLRIGEDTEFLRRMDRPDRPVWAPSVQAVHLNPTTFRHMVEDQLVRGVRDGLHWTPPGTQSTLWRTFRRFMLIAPLSFRAVRGIDRLFVLASWPLVLVCALAHEIGVNRGHRLRAAKSAEAARTVPTDNEA